MHSSSHVNGVRIDDDQAGYRMARHLVALGHQHIGFVAGNPKQRDFRQQGRHGGGRGGDGAPAGTRCAG